MRHAELKVVSGKQAGTTIPLPEGKFLIGREEDCHLRPNSDLVSRHHCVFTVDEFAVRIRDLGSTNGTLVNGERIRGGVMLNPGDVVSIGKIEFQIVIPDTSLETKADMALETETQMVNPAESAPAQPPASPIVVEPESAYEIPASTDTLNDIPLADPGLGAVPPLSTGDTQFAPGNQPMPMQPALGYPPQMGYPQMMPYGYPGFPGMYPQQMGYPMPGGYPPQMPMSMPPPMQMPMQMPEPQMEEPAEVETNRGNIPEIKLPNPEDTGAKPPAPKPVAAAGSEADKKTAEAKSKEEAPKMADSIIQQYLKRRPSTGK